MNPPWKGKIMLPQDWGSKRKGGPLGMAVILWPKIAFAFYVCRQEKDKETAMELISMQ